MKKRLYFVIFLAAFFSASAQQKKADSLISVLKSVTDNKKKIEILKQLTDQQNDAPVIIEYAGKGIALAEKLNQPKDEEYFQFDLVRGYFKSDDYPKQLDMCFKGLVLSRKLHDDHYSLRFLNGILIGYGHGKEYHKAINYGLEGLHVAERIKEKKQYSVFFDNIGLNYIKLHMLDSAMSYIKRAYRSALELHDPNIGYSISGLGLIEDSLHHKNLALSYYRQAIPFFKKSNLFRDRNLASGYIHIANIYVQTHLQDSAFYYTSMAYNIASKAKDMSAISDAARLLSSSYEGRNDKESLRYYKIAVAAKDSLLNDEKAKQFQIISLNERMREADLKQAAIAYQNKMRLYVVILALALTTCIIVFLWLNNKKQQKANVLLSEQKREIEEQRDQTNKALGELQKTQTQLIQSEKMASLGELTAGIAHEIQNPLNFVNNFSEVNTELIDELQEERNKNIRDLKSENDILNTIRENEQKINMHGKRADSIVKSMLEHSRASSGQKELTDLNALADEYMRLSYHGLRAKDKTFNSAMEPHLDGDLPKVNVVPQDIGRVLLNLFNNAFYAVHQKKKQNPEGYSPQVTLTTSHKNGFIEITVKDNGNGIPDNIKDKVMQPFFTTKPTGEGTGLGLSLSYDIVVKAHGGSIGVNGKEGEGSEFIIKLPV
jgi:two-component system NtrC family sensor kinase